MTAFVLIAVAMVSGKAWAQTQTQINADLKTLEARLNAAWTADTHDAFRSLYHTEGADQQQINSRTRYWHNLKVGNRSTESITVKTLYTKYNLPPRLPNPNDKALHDELVKSVMNPAMVIDDRSYDPNLEVVGIAEVVLNRWKEQGPITLLLSVGYDQERKLQLTLYKSIPTPRS